MRIFDKIDLVRGENSIKTGWSKVHNQNNYCTERVRIPAKDLFSKDKMEGMKRHFLKNKAVATASVACGWAGAVMWRAGAVGGAVYTRASVTCDWAGAVMQKLPAEYRCDGRTDGRTDRPTDRPTDRATYRDACTRLKIG